MTETAVLLADNGHGRGTTAPLPPANRAAESGNDAQADEKNRPGAAPRREYGPDPVAPPPDLRPATRRDIAPHRATSKTGGGGTMQAAQGEAGTGT